MKESNQQRAGRLLKPYRRKIDRLDDQILKLLGERFGIVRQVARIKAEHDLPSFLLDRVVEVRGRSVQCGKKYGIDPAFVHLLYSAIIYQSCAVEDEIKHKLKNKKRRHG